MFKVVVVPMVENYIVSYNSRILAYDQLNCRFKLLIAVVNTQVIIRLHYYGFTFQLITNLSTSARQEAKNYNAWWHRKWNTEEQHTRHHLPSAYYSDVCRSISMFHTIFFTSIATHEYIPSDNICWIFWIMLERMNISHAPLLLTSIRSCLLMVFLSPIL
jgi:hypothetical protein